MFNPDISSFSVTDPNNNNAQYGGNMVRFVDHYIKTPVYEGTQIYVEIVSVGDRGLHVFRKATEDDMEVKYPQAFAKYKERKAGKETAEMEGRPLDRWAEMTRELVEHFNFNRVYTIEQLAGLSDSVCQKVGLGTVDWREKAKKFLEENSAEKETIEQLKARIAQLEASNGDDAPATPRRGRPRKEQPIIGE